MFCDELKIRVIAGKGGDGCVSFRREKFVSRGGPDGGDGGKGGDVILKINANLNTLGHLAHQKIYKASDGISGARKKMHGKNGESLTIEVPSGTIVLTGDKTRQLADLTGPDNIYRAANGGKGGLGNARFTSSTRQAPRFAEKGEPGQEVELSLELKLVADVGLIGLPSAGKSTLISVISNARPKIAAYHFTTLTPNLGVVSMEKFGGTKTDNFIVADIPGLIEGASKGKGLGLQFLKHISRTGILVHVIDASLKTPQKNYQTINKELKKFDSKLGKIKQIIAINKTDLVDENIIKKNHKKLSQKAKIFPISALKRTGLKPLLFEVLQELKKTRSKSATIVSKITPVLKPHENQVQFTVEKIIRKKDRKIFRITGKKIEQLIVMSDLNNDEALERVYHYIEKSGIKRAIKKEGAEIGDTIRIKSTNIPYRK